MTTTLAGLTSRLIYGRPASGHVLISVQRALFLNGKRFEAGEVIEVGLIDAAACTATGRAAYVHPEDRQRCIAACRAADDKASQPLRGARGSFWTREK